MFTLTGVSFYNAYGSYKTNKEIPQLAILRRVSKDLKEHKGTNPTETLEYSINAIEGLKYSNINDIEINQKITGLENLSNNLVTKLKVVNEEIKDYKTPLVYEPVLEKVGKDIEKITIKFDPRYPAGDYIGGGIICILIGVLGIFAWISCEYSRKKTEKKKEFEEDLELTLSNLKEATKIIDDFIKE